MVDSKQLRAFLDADTFVYACGFAADAQKKREWLETGDTRTLDEAKEQDDYERWALANTKSVINDLQHIFNPDVECFLTGSGNFRDQLATLAPYKGNRDTTHKPKYYKQIIMYLKDTWQAHVVHGREADDALGCAQWGSEPDTTVIVSIDKDLDMIPGYHYNWRKKELYHTTQDQSDYFFWKQVLMGDRTDNILGIPGIGEVKADKILTGTDRSWTSMSEAALAAYQNNGLGWAEMHENASLLWIQREENKNWDDRDYSYEHPVMEE